MTGLFRFLSDVSTAPTRMIPHSICEVILVTHPTLRLANVGGLANRMIELIFAKSLQTLVPGLVIANVSIPEWNIHYDDVEINGSRLVLPIQMKVDLFKLASMILAEKVDFIEYYGYAQHMTNFLKDQIFTDRLFPLGEEDGYGDDTLVINIRGDEILDGRHPAYVLVPLLFYKKIVENTGLKPVFVGQITESQYMTALRAQFPRAEFRRSGGARRDFDVLRKSKHIVPAVSTFSWLAAWLSSATIHFPVLGLFNPFQEEDHMLLPLSEARYRFYLFPISYSVPVSSFAKAHAAIEHNWEAVSSDALRARLVAAPRQRATILDYIYAFDPTFYRRRWGDIEAQFGTDESLARLHYTSHGFNEKRSAFAFDERFYLESYPDAACAVGRGEYATAIDHYLLVGAACGYRAIEEEGSAPS